MLRFASGLVRRRLPGVRFDGGGAIGGEIVLRSSSSWEAAATSASSPSLSIWRRKKEMGKEGLFVVHELKRLGSGPRLERFMQSHVSRLLRTDLLAVLAEFQRQDLVFLSLKVPSLSYEIPHSCLIFIFLLPISYQFAIDWRDSEWEGIVLLVRFWCSSSCFGTRWKDVVLLVGVPIIHHTMVIGWKRL